jgi:hypothetical protein
VTIHGQVAWQGKVEEFELTANPFTRICYGWAVKGAAGVQEVSSVLGFARVDSPEVAVEAAIATNATKYARISPRAREIVDRFQSIV